jgi:pimeloyl-ACP methyl ester carboxylesterase
VGHDHGGAIAQLIAAEHPGRIERLVLTNCEDYDNWPSAEEKPFILLTQLPVLGRGILWLWSRPALFRLVLASGAAVMDQKALTSELSHGYVRANLSDVHRRAKTRLSLPKSSSDRLYVGQQYGRMRPFVPHSAKGRLCGS